MSVSFEKSIPQEVLCHVLSFCSPEENFQTNALVCRTWSNVAPDVAKMQMIEQFQQDIQSKAANFLKMVPENLQNLASYCPSYAKLNEVKANRREYSIEEVHHIARNNSLLTLEKYASCMNRFYRTVPECPYIPAEKTAELSGRVFIDILYKIDHVGPNEGSYNICMFKKPQYRPGKEEPMLFPIELFNVTVSEDNNTVEGEINEGTYCFALNGRLIEVMLEEGRDEVDRTIHSFGLFPDGEPKTSVDKETKRSIEEDLYVAKLDAPAKAPEIASNVNL